MSAGTAILYTKRLPVEIEIFKRICLNGNCVARWTGEKECIYRSSQKIAVGYEIGWEYVDSVNTSKQTFSGFAKLMNNRYQIRSEETIKFMSLPRFIEWWFGWASHMKIDFRKSCPSCESCNKLAFDGTKLGVGFQNAFVDPIETPEETDAILTKLRRHDRCFIVTADKSQPMFFQRLRSTLRNVSKRVLKEDAGDTFSKATELTSSLRSHIPERSQELFDQLMFGTDVTDTERKAIAKHFKELAYDASIDTVLPFVETENVINFCYHFYQNSLGLREVLMLSNHFLKYNRSISELISTSATNNTTGFPSNAVLSHLEYLATAVRNLHNEDVSPCNAEKMAESCNPPKYGRAFYFQDHGQQIRRMRCFSKDKERKKSLNFDDASEEVCSKIFLQVRKKRDVVFVCMVLP